MISCQRVKKREGFVPEMGTKPLKALRGYRASNRGSEKALIEALRLRTLPRATGVSRALRARNPIKVWKMSPWASGPGAPKSLEKVSKKSEKSGNFKVSKVSVRDFCETFRHPGAPAPGDFFQTFLGFRARRARETPVARGRVRNSKGL